MAYQSEIEKLEARFREKPEQWFAALADAYRKSGDIEMALEVLNAWIEKRPNYSSGNIVLGRCLLEQGKFDAAVAAFDRVLALDMENIIALKSMAEIAEKRGDAEGATSWLEKLLEADPMNDEAQQAKERIARGELHLASAEEPATVEETEPTGAEAEAQPVAGGEPAAAEQPEPPVPEEPAVVEPVAAEAPPEDLAAIAEQDTVPFEASPPPIVTEEQAAQAETAGDETVADLEPMEFAGIGGEEAAPLDGLEPAGLEETVLEMEPVQLEETVDELPETPMPEHLVPSASSDEDTLVEAPAMDLPLVQPPEDAPAAAPPEPSVSQDEVQFVEQSAEEEAAPIAMEAGAAAEEEQRPELPIILPEEVEPDLDEPVLEEPSIREPEPVVTETMAELYVSQGLFGEAVDIYEQLLARNPGDVRFEKRLAEVREKADGEIVEAQPSRHDRYASDKTGGVSVRQLFADLAQGPVAGAAPATAVEEAPPAAEAEPSSGGFSFDQYFGSSGDETIPDVKPAPEPADEGGSGSGQSGDFQDWLKGLKS